MQALKVNEKDNVATVFADNVNAGTYLDVHNKKGEIQRMIALGDIPYGHKLAVKNIDKGDPVIKYGEEIGIATKDIRSGDYVHVHNLDSMRGRGDLGE